MKKLDIINKTLSAKLKILKSKEEERNEIMTIRDLLREYSGMVKVYSLQKEKFIFEGTDVELSNDELSNEEIMLIDIDFDGLVINIE